MRHNRERVLSLRLLSLALCFSGTALAHSDSHLALKGKHARLVARDDSPAYNDPTTLNPPAIPSPAPATAFDLALPTSPSGLSITHSGAFIGFSVEFSVSTIVCECRALCPLYVPGLKICSVEQWARKRERGPRFVETD